MHPSLSAFFEYARFSAAVIVVLSHVEESWIPGNLPYLSHVGLEAVSCFFVISGYVIAFVANTKEKTIKDYAIRRVSRIYSVVLPCLFLTYVADELVRIYFHNYHTHTWPSIESTCEIYNLLLSTIFLNETWHTHILAGSNAPFWSICNEVWYYIIFGAFYFLQGWKRFIIAVAACVVAGPKILLLFPLWLLGSALFWISKLPSKHNKLPIKGIRTIMLFTVFGWGVWEFGYYKVLNTWLYISYPVFLAQMYFSGFIFATLIFLFPRAHIECPLSKNVKTLANSTFVLYLIHYPVSRFLMAALPASNPVPIKYALLIAVPVGLALMLTEITDRLQTFFRLSLSRCLKVETQAAATTP